MILGPDARKHEELWRVDGTGGDDDLIASIHDMAEREAIELDGHGALAIVEDQLGGVREGDHVQIWPALDGLEEGLRSGAARASALGALRYGKSCLNGSVQIDVRVAQMFARLGERHCDRRHVWWRRHSEVAADAMIT